MSQLIVRRKGGVLIGIPKRVDPKKPVVVAVHGHEISARGTLPWELFDMWAGRFVEDGYVVLAPAHLWYDRIGDLRHPDGAGVAEWDEVWHKTVGVVDYPMEWAKRVNVLIDSTLPHLPAHDGLVVVGLSAGGLTSAILMAMRSDIYAGVFAGSFISLDYLREQYRIKGHPDNWDIGWLNNYSTLYALLVPRPVQWQIGRLDTFWPSADGTVAPNHRFPGLARKQAADEVWGEFSILKLLWAKFQASPEMYIHSGGHEVDYSAASEFVKRIVRCKGRLSECRADQDAAGGN